MAKGISLDDALGSAYDQAITDHPEFAEETIPQAEVVSPAPVAPLEIEEPETEQSVPTKLSDLIVKQPQGTPDPTEKRVVKLSDGTFVDEVEAAAGYMRQSDYTKKTTELAEQRKDPKVMAALELAEQLSTDPIGTVAELARRFEIIDDSGYKDAINFARRPQGVTPTPKPAAFTEDKIAELVSQKAKEAFEEMKANDPAFKEYEVRRSQERLVLVFQGIEAAHSEALDEADRNAIVSKAIEWQEPNLEYVYLKLKAELNAKKAEGERIRTAQPKKSSGAGGVKNLTPNPIPKTIEESWALAEMAAG